MTCASYDMHCIEEVFENADDAYAFCHRAQDDEPYGSGCSFSVEAFEVIPHS